MIKKLDILLIRSFIGPFVVTFFVALFVLVMQFFWLYMDELIGKGISILVLGELLVYMSAVLVPLALPLAVLLSSIMTFGNLGENFELVAIKSSGISLLRFMQPLLIVIIALSGLAFVFANNIMPVANLKALSLLYDMRNKKSTFIIKPSKFNSDIQGFSIRVGSLDKETGKIRDVLIYDHSDMVGNNKVVIAREGEIVNSPDKQALILRLRDGWQYHEGFENGAHNYTQVRMHFDEWDKAFDLSSFKFTRSNEDMFRNANQMMNVAQLVVAIDSTKRQKYRSAAQLSSNVSQYVVLESKGADHDKVATALASTTTGKAQIRAYDTSFRELVPDTAQKPMIQNLVNNVRNLKSLVDVMALDSRLQTENWMKYEVELHRKFTLSFACLLLFLIGAPLGAIIRKGGLGMPLVVAVAFFVAFHMLNISGEKLAKSEAVEPWLGMWMSSIILAPLSIWLIGKARNDSRIFTKEWYTRAAKAVAASMPAFTKKKS